MRTALLPSPFPYMSEFAFWLDSLDPHAVVSDAWDCTSCPLATFLKSCGFEDPAVFAPGRGWCNTGRDTPIDRRREMPAWAMEFVYWADKVKPRALTAADCKYLLTGPHFNANRWVNA